MSGSFDKKGGGSEASGKRPTPTIEGTATEVVDSSPKGDSGSGGEPREEDVKALAAGTSEAEGAKTEEPATDDGNTDGQADDTAAPGDGDDRENGNGEDAGAAEEEPAPAAAAPREERSVASRLLATLIGLFTHALAGLVGALAVLLAIAWGYLPPGALKGSLGIGPLEDRVTQLEATPEATDGDAALTSLDTRLNSVDARLKSVDQRTQEIPSQLTALTDRVSQLEASLKSMAEAAKAGGSVADAAAISQQIGEAEARLDEKIKTALESASATNSAAIATLEKEVAGLDARLKALAEAKLDAGDDTSLGPEIADLGDRIDAIEASMPELADAFDKDASDTRAAAAAIALASLREAVSAGRPYAAELSTLTKLSPDLGDLGSLPDYEETGMPTLRALTTSFGEVRRQALTAAPSGSSIIDRILGSAESLIKVTRVDETAEGNSPDAVLARAGAQLSKGNLDGAVVEVEALEGPPAKAFADWLKDARARLDAEVILRRLQNVLLVSLGNSGAAGIRADEEHQE